MAGFKVTPEELQAGSTHIAGFARQIGEQLQQTRTEVTRLADGWTGAAHTSFEDAMRKFDSAAKQQQEALATLSDLLGKGSQHYADTEDAVRKSFPG